MLLYGVFKTSISTKVEAAQQKAIGPANHNGHKELSSLWKYKSLEKQEWNLAYFIHIESSYHCQVYCIVWHVTSQLCILNSKSDPCVNMLLLNIDMP